MKEDVIYINGKFVKEGDARISPFNRGFLYGDGLFETMRTYRGKVFALEKHIERLRESALFMRITFPFRAEDVNEIIMELLLRNSMADTDSRIRLNLVRGGTSRGLLPDKDAEPEVVISAEEVPAEIEKVQGDGVGAMVVRGIRVDSGSSFACHKTLNYAPGVLGLMDVRSRGGHEGILLNNYGNICEGITSNIFVVNNGIVRTPPLSAGILPGITRDVVIRVAREAGITVIEKDISETGFLGAGEIFITSSVREVVPVVVLEEKNLEIGPVTREIQACYKHYVAESLRFKA